MQASSVVRAKGNLPRKPALVINQQPRLKVVNVQPEPLAHNAAKDNKAVAKDVGVKVVAQALRLVLVRINLLAARPAVAATPVARMPAGQAAPVAVAPMPAGLAAWRLRLSCKANAASFGYWGRMASRNHAVSG